MGRLTVYLEAELTDLKDGVGIVGEGRKDS